MTAPELMPDCPTEETLAAFADDQLTPEERQAVIEHLTICGDCRELVMLAADIKASGELIEAPRAATNVVPFRKRRPWLPAAGIAAAAAIVAFINVAWTPEMDKLAKAAAELKRPMEGRFASAEFTYQEAEEVFRTGNTEDSSDGSDAGVLAVAADSTDPHVLGVAYLLMSDRKERAKAIPTLKEAQARAKGDERDAVDLDLSAALSRRGSPEDLKEALTLADNVWKRKRSPVAAWNRAVAIELLRQDDDRPAIQAWKDYLTVDSSSKWADEAREKITRLEDPNY